MNFRRLLTGAHLIRSDAPVCSTKLALLPLSINSLATCTGGLPPAMGQCHSVPPCRAAPEN